MLLDRIDIDAHGPLSRVEIGPLAEHLNVICSPTGSGKTAIVRFVRDSLVSRRYPIGMMNSSTGRVVWADRNGLIHCRREQDGTVEGRRTIEFESRGDRCYDHQTLQHSWLGPLVSGTHASRAAGTIELPESIVDCVITDTAVTNVSRVVSACIRSGLDSPDTYRSLPLSEDRDYFDHDLAADPARMGYAEAAAPLDGVSRHRTWRAQLADVEAELARLEPNSAGTHFTDRASLVARRTELLARLSRRREPVAACETTDQHHRLQHLADQADQLRRRQNELRRWIVELDAELARVRTIDHAPYRFVDRSYANYRETLYRDHAGAVDESLRSRLEDLDAQMIRWRRMLMEVRGLRETVLGQRRDATGFPSPLDEVARRRQRLDGFLHALDRYDRDRRHRDQTWSQYYNDVHRSQCQAEEIETRIDAATRQIDWLLERYRSDRLHDAWYQPLPHDRPAASRYAVVGSLAETLQAIRHDLHQVAGATRRQHRHHQSAQGNLAAEVGKFQRLADIENASELDELQRTEAWLVSAIEQLSQHRESLLRDFTANLSTEYASAVPFSGNIHFWDAAGYEQERLQRTRELEHVTAQLHACHDEAASIRARLTTKAESPFDRDAASRSTLPHRYPWIDDEAIRSELSQIDEALAIHARIDWLRTRRAELLERLQAVRPVAPAASPLAADASRWLIRLSAGRLRRIEWNPTEVSGRDRDRSRQHHPAGVYPLDANGAHLADHCGVRIDGREEVDCSAADRALAVLAVRMAAGDLLARTGRTVPLLIETCHERWADDVRHREPASLEANPYSLRGFDHQDYGTPLAFYRYGDDRASNHPIATALHDYARTGRQVVVLTSDFSLSDQLARAGGRRFDLHRQQTIHPHRPLWRPHYEPENYVGPYPHADMNHVGRHDDRRREPPRHDTLRNDINRNFDVAWRETYGIDDNVDLHPTVASPRATAATTDWAVDGVDYRDGYYHASTYTTDAPSRRQRGRHESVRPESPFFLTVDSPIDQAPSIDAIAAARLRRLGVSHINHLMQQDPNRLSDALGLANVDAASIRRWQSECRLVCRVPQLRGFDARILVGCGITDPAQLAAIAPATLLERVKNFLATERGQRILLSGSSYELSRITSWIAAANQPGVKRQLSGSRRRRLSDLDAASVELRSTLPVEFDDFDNARYEYEFSGDDQSSQTGRSRNVRARTSTGTNDGAVTRSSTVDRESRRTERRARRRTNDSPRDLVRLADERLAESYRDVETETPSQRKSRREDAGQSERSTTSVREGRRRRKRRSREGASRDAAVSVSTRRPGSDYRSTDSYDSTGRSRSYVHETELRFYLQRSSDIVDAPSIGPRMGERLNKIGLYTVDDLLQADPEHVAAELDHSRIDADTVIAWQQQAALVCRVPMLRGHDAQLLVAAEVTTPEELVTYTADDLFALINPISHSREGKRILRGGRLPDLAEISEWLHYAQHHRELIAA